MDGPSSPRRARPIFSLVAIAVVIFGTIANLFILVRHAVPRTFPDGFARVGGDLGFVRWSEASGMGELEPNALFAVVNGKIVGRFEFRTREYETLASAGICDNSQRPWINVEHTKGTFHVNCYPEGDTDIGASPEVTYVDTNGNGILDRKVDWLAKKTYDLVSPPTWKPFTSRDDSADD